MASFETAVEFVLANEGGLSESRSDSGGITNFGISLRFLREVKEENLRKYGIFGAVNENTIRHLTKDQAKLIYRGEFWEGNNFEEIHFQNLCNYIFDMSINHGIFQAIKFVQSAVCAATFVRGFLRIDGIIGSKTLDAINFLGDNLLPILVGLRADFYRDMVVNRPKDEVNLNGWLDRCYSVIKRGLPGVSNDVSM